MYNSKIKFKKAFSLIISDSALAMAVKLLSCYVTLIFVLFTRLSSSEALVSIPYPKAISL
uniref:Uncharacterized protein n=1 Tax=Rhizophora mucronata TaxID=61149 RepID=A0A2P2NNV5_RHIMU